MGGIEGHGGGKKNQLVIVQKKRKLRISWTMHIVITLKTNKLAPVIFLKIKFQYFNRYFEGLLPPYFTNKFVVLTFHKINNFMIQI